MRRATLLAVCVCLTLSGVSWVSAAEKPVLLFPADSGKVHENIIGDYCRDVEGWKLRYELYKGDANDVILRIAWDLGDIPDITVKVDSRVSGRNRETNAVMSNRIKLWAYMKYGIGKDHPRRAETLEVLNSIAATKVWPQRVFLDKDGDVVLEAHIVISGKDVPVHPGQVAYEIRRMATGWKYVYAALKKAGIHMSN